MALDDNVKTAAVIHDISVNTVEVSATQDIAKSGLFNGHRCFINITEFTGQAVGAVTFAFEISRDAGTTWRDVGSREVPQAVVATAAAPRQFDFPIGFHDVQPERIASLKWRVSSRIAATVASADDFSWTAYIADAQGRPGSLA